jgi:hypothetical protein
MQEVFKEYKTHLLGLSKLKDWPCIKWSIEIPGLSEPMEYHTGLGHAFTKQDKKEKQKILTLSSSDKEIFCMDLLKAYNLKNSFYLNSLHHLYVKIPKIEDVLECLKTDKECGEMSFYEFCENFGYDKDSISALNTHFACMQTAQKMRNFDFSKYLTEEN